VVKKKQDGRNLLKQKEFKREKEEDSFMMKNFKEIVQDMEKVQNLKMFLG